MSELDKRFLAHIGITAGQAAGMIGKSRQAVCKGLNGEDDYLRPTDLARIAAKVAEEMPQRVGLVDDAVSSVVRVLAERIGARPPTFEPMFSALGRASRIWLVLPSHLEVAKEQPEPYEKLFSAIRKRAPNGLAEEEPLEIIVFCDAGRVAIEEEFPDVWFEQRLVAFVECRLVRHMIAPILVVDPHLEDGLQCYTLAHCRFVTLTPGRAAKWVRDFADEMTRKVRQASREQNECRFNARIASAAHFLDAEIDEI